MEKTFLSPDEIKAAKKIPILDVLKAFGCNCEIEKQSKRGEIFCKSPFRPEKKASFKVSIPLNTWIDFGLAGSKKGGNVFDLVMRLANVTLSEAFTVLKDKNLTHLARDLPNSESPESPEDEPEIIIKKIIDLQHPALIQYLESRKISKKTASSYLKEIHSTRNGTPYFALAFPNDSGGYELRNPYFKGFFHADNKKKDVTLIKGRDKDSSGLLVFEGFMDFLSSIEHFRRRPANDVLVLNSTFLTLRIEDILARYKTIYCFLDNDDSGEASLKEIKQMASGREVVDQSRLYGGFQDFNEFLMKSERGLER